ncbi:Sec-independent protein translocase protein TatB [Pasteurella sp. PK-2025]|uniref:Sec-independent protein translocase protein TatB n=1 Tax=Pasteurella sp. PK-2025 TaxID=3413133 RepID=UPI003C7550DE
MFDIGFFELALIFVIGLVVLGPTRLPVAIRTVMGWIATVRGLANNVQNELKQELKLQELQESIKKAEQFNLQQLSPELGKTVEELKTSAEKLRTALDEKAAATNTTLAEQVEAIKQSVEPTLKHAAEQQAEHAVEPTESHEETISEMTALSPAEQAELAEAQDEMAHIQQYYPDDDMMDDPVLPASHSQSQLQDKKA